MASTEPCPCNCCLDPANQMLLTSTTARYNDRSAFANNLQQDSVVQMQNMFQATAQNTLEQTPQTTMMDQQSLTAALSQLISAARTP